MKKAQKIELGKAHYKKHWGNFKSDKWKKKTILKVEISVLLRNGFFTKKDLIEILELVRKRAFDGSMFIFPKNEESEIIREFIEQEEMEI